MMHKGWFSRLFPTLIFGILIWTSASSHGQRMKKEIDVQYASMESVRPILKQTLSPNGKFVMLPSKGSVMVIDDMEFVAAAENALAGAQLPNPNVNLNFGFKTGLPVRRSSIHVGREVFFPTGWSAPKIPNSVVVGPGGTFPITPAHPTGFQMRRLGVTSETVSTLNPDGTITMDINMENSSFEGFINYGSAIMPAGAIGNVPVNGQVGNPNFFQPLIPNNILMPIISTTRISTSIVVRPRVAQGQVRVDMMPRFTIHTEEEGAENIDVDLKQFITTVEAANNQLGQITGFKNAGADFNRNFLGAKDPSKGGTAIVFKATISPPTPQTESASSSSTDTVSATK